MRVTSDHTKDAWKARVKAGAYQPIVRATVERAELRKIPYNTDDAPGGDYDHDRSRKGIFTTILFGGNHSIRELRNIRSISWSRSVEQEIAECTLTLLNTDIVPIGTASRYSEFDNPGAFSPIRGVRASDEAKQRWDFDLNEGWNEDLQPDRLLKTYEGYGSNPEMAPGDDPLMHLSGTWLIDEVQYAANGDLVIKARDVGRLLLDQIVFPPVIPTSDYPLIWSTIRQDEVEGRAPKGGRWQRLRGTCTSSNMDYVGKGILDVPTYVSSRGGVLGHLPRHAITADDNRAYWLSTAQTTPRDKVWWQINLTRKTSIAALRLATRGGPYRVYVSLHNGSRWLGRRRVPYEVTTAGVDIGADIPYVESFRADRGIKFDHVLRRKYRDIKRIRLTFTDLRQQQPGRDYKFRAGLKDVLIYGGTYSKLGFDRNGTVLKAVGNITDFTSIVKWVGAWGGFYWAWDDPQLNFMRTSTFGAKRHFSHNNFDQALPKGRVWGQFQATGTSPVADLTADTFDKQPLLEIIRECKNMTGFVFFIEEAGGMVWRLPNLYSFGNYDHPHRVRSPNSPRRTNDFVTIDETTTLVDYTARTSSRNLRERIAVTDAQGKYGAVTPGYSPTIGRKPNLRRLVMWSDSHFASNREALVAADLIAARQMFDYRRGKVTIWGNPAIQIDDQVRIFERTTNETYFHYVTGISCTLDMEQGTWEYTLETHWLGQDPNDAWLLDVQRLKKETRDYLALLGAVD